MMRIACALALALLCGCGSEAPKTVETPVAKKPAAPPTDETRRFPMDSRESVEPQAGPLFGMEFLPGGNVATYKSGAKTWKQFVIRNDDAGQTAVLLSKCKDALKDAKFIAHMGGYYGLNAAGEPMFVFPKGRWLAGTVGLPEKEADTAGRVMALRLD